VRLAKWLLDGVRQGQPLGALLGYRFERRLQEAAKAQFIASFRELAPLVARKMEQTTEAVEAIAANNVVDGLELHRKWRAALAPAVATRLRASSRPSRSRRRYPISSPPRLSWKRSSSPWLIPSTRSAMR